MKKMSTVELQIAERARKFKGEALYNLHHFIDASLLQESYEQLNRKSAEGIDGKTWQQYGVEFPERRESLLDEFKSGRYRAPALRRVYIPKDKHGQRPIDINTTEDKVLQESFRPGRSQHQAIDYMFEKVSFEKMHYIIDADIKNYFGSINHGILREFLDIRVKDGVIRRMIDKWLKAGIMESGSISYPDSGTKQGSVISPLLSNIYLHYVLDEWFSDVIQPLLKGKSFIVRFADDCILGFTDRSDAERVMEVLPKRLAKYGLTLHPEKTKLIDLNSERGRSGRSFDFLGFTHYLGKSRKGNKVLKRKTNSKRLTRAIKNISNFIKLNRHMKLRDLIAAINVKLRGHYAYYGIYFNYRGVLLFYELVKRSLTLVEKWDPLPKPKIYHSYVPS